MPQGSKLIELIFETHASSVDNEARLASGHFDAPLSARGELLRECDYGRLTRHPSGEVEAVRVRFITEPFPGGESYADVVTRVRAFLQGGTGLAAGPGQPGRAVPPRCGSQRHALCASASDRDGIPLTDAIAAPCPWQPGWRFWL